MKSATRRAHISMHQYSDITWRLTNILKACDLQIDVANELRVKGVMKMKDFEFKQYKNN